MSMLLAIASTNERLVFGFSLLQFSAMTFPDIACDIVILKYQFRGDDSLFSSHTVLGSSDFGLQLRGLSLWNKITLND